MIGTIDEGRVYAALPSKGFLREYVLYAARATDCNAAFHIGGGLAILAQTTPMQYGINFGGQLYSNLYVMLVGPSTFARKTAAVKIARDVLGMVLPEQIGEDPGSHQGLAEQLRHQPQVLFMYEEFGDFLSKAEQGYLTALKTAFTSLYDNSPFGRALAKQQRGAVKDPRVSLIGAVAQDLLERHTEPTDWTGGFLGRFLTFASERVRTYEPPPVNVPGRDRVYNLLRIRADAHAEPAPCSGFTSDAEQLWRDWTARLTHRRLDEANQQEIRAAIGRTPGMVAKIALLLAWDLGSARRGESWAIGEEELSTAIQIAEMHVESVIHIGQFLTGSRDMRDRRTVLSQINGHPISLGKIIMQAKLLKPRTQQIIETLLEEGTIRQVAVANARGTHYTLAPTAEERAAQDAAVVDIFSGKPHAATMPIARPLAFAEDEEN